MGEQEIDIEINIDIGTDVGIDFGMTMEVGRQIYEEK